MIEKKYKTYPVVLVESLDIVCLSSKWQDQLKYSPFPTLLYSTYTSPRTFNIWISIFLLEIFFKLASSFQFLLIRVYQVRCEGKRLNEFAEWHGAWLAEWHNYAECKIWKMAQRNKLNWKTCAPFFLLQFEWASLLLVHSLPLA